MHLWRLVSFNTARSALGESRVRSSPPSTSHEDGLPPTTVPPRNIHQVEGSVHFDRLSPILAPSKALEVSWAMPSSRKCSELVLIPASCPPLPPPSHSSPLAQPGPGETFCLFLAGISHHAHTRPVQRAFSWLLLRHEAAILLSVFKIGIGNNGRGGVQNKSLTRSKALTCLTAESVGWGGMFYGIYFLVSGTRKTPRRKSTEWPPFSHLLLASALPPTLG